MDGFHHIINGMMSEGNGQEEGHLHHTGHGKHQIHQIISNGVEHDINPISVRPLPSLHTEIIIDNEENSDVSVGWIAHDVDFSHVQGAKMIDPVELNLDDVFHNENHWLMTTATANPSFCSSKQGMIMYMDGFRFSLFGNQPCLNLYFPGWTLDTRGKFVAAMLGILFLGFMTEGIAKLRFSMTKRLKGRGSLKKWTITGLHALQALVGYVLMLATMTFSVEILLCVVAGLGVGYAVFYEDKDSHVTSNPCCDFIQAEADERNQKTDSLRAGHSNAEIDDDGEARPLLFGDDSSPSPGADHSHHLPATETA